MAFKEVAKKEMIRVRVSAAELQQYNKLAEKLNVSLSELIRTLLSEKIVMQ